MNFHHIVCIYDLLRKDTATSEGILDFIREPIKQGTGLDIGNAPTGSLKHNLIKDFDFKHFQNLSLTSSTYVQEIDTYHQISDAAQKYLIQHIPENSLLLSFEMPNWLRKACLIEDIKFLDVRYSPLRFGRDLYFALDTSSKEIRENLQKSCVSEDELRLESSLLAANIRMHKGRQAERLRYYFNLDNTLIYIGQHPKDPALLAENGSLLNCGNFQKELLDAVNGRQVLHLADYDDELYGYAQRERNHLSELLGISVRPCMQNAYQVLSAHDNIVLTGISSHVLQEAAWFGRKAHMLGQPCVPLSTNENPEHGFLQVRFNDLIAPEFWHSLLAPDSPKPKLGRLPTVSRHHGRESTDSWWDYEKVMTWQRTLSHASFERMGGGLLKQRVSALENNYKQILEKSETSPKATEFSSGEAIRALKNSKAGKTAYVLGNGPSLKDFNLSHLLNQESFWCNAAFNIEKFGIDFCPKYYFIGDYIAFQKLAPEVMKIKAGIKFFRNTVYHLAKKNYPDEILKQNIIWYEGRETPGMDMCDGEDNFSYDPSVRAFSGWSIVLEAIQFAFYMGYSRVYVAGVDIDFSNSYYLWEKGTHRQKPSDDVLRKIYQSFIVAKKHFQNNGRILAKITKSPNLPLDFIEDKSVQ